MVKKLLLKEIKWRGPCINTNTVTAAGWFTENCRQQKNLDHPVLVTMMLLLCIVFSKQTIDIIKSVFFFLVIGCGLLSFDLGCWK